MTALNTHPRAGYLARELVNVLASPPGCSQIDFARKAKIDKSKLSRLIAGRTPCDKQTLDQLLSATENRQARGRLVRAYIQDLASVTAIQSLQTSASSDPWQQIEAAKLSPKAKLALRWLLDNRLEAAEKIFIDLASALGWRP